MAEVLGDIRGQMQAAGLRVTPQRYAVYTELCRRQDHPTAEQLIEAVNREMPMASTAAVYGALKSLRDARLVREVLLQEGVTRYDARIDRHHHFVCDRCGRIHDLDWQQLPNLNLTALPPGLSPSSYELVVRGTCCAG